MSTDKFSLLTAVVCIWIILCDNANGQQNQQQNLRRRQRRRPARIAQESFNSLTINYPMSVFTDYVDGAKDWKLPAYYSPELKQVSDFGKPYTDYAHAQDQEDVWLYENWFYGMKEGVIMESGALDGKLFSTSYMFEKFSNWTALHVGKSHILLCSGFALH